jgi:hypothetical protein
LTIHNTGTNTLTIQGIALNWAGDTSGQQLLELKIDGSSVWSGTDSNSPSTFPDEFSWSGGANLRQVSSGATVTLEMTFGTSLDSTGYSITVTFHPGCTVGGSR